MRSNTLYLFFCVLITFFSCQEKEERTTVAGLDATKFVAEVSGKPTALYVLKNKQGMEVCVTNYGGRIVSVMVPDKEEQMQDVVLGYDNIQDYLNSDGNFGAIIGRYGNRIAQGRFTLDSVEYQLPQNNDGNCLHGGDEGFHARVWDVTRENEHSISLSYRSADGECGFPGNLEVTVHYTVTEDNALDICYEATTDRPTVVNLTNHSYFNLAGHRGSQILDQQVMIAADTFTPVDSLMIPTGALLAVDSTPMDLRTLVEIGRDIDAPYTQLALGRGFDHNWVLNTQGDFNTLAAKAVSLESGIVLEVYTDEPAIQFYTGNFMSGDDVGKFGVIYPHRGAFCLETQHYPDSPNRPEFPGTTLRPDETYVSRCKYLFTLYK